MLNLCLTVYKAKADAKTDNNLVWHYLATAYGLLQYLVAFFVMTVRSGLIMCLKFASR